MSTNQTPAPQGDGLFVVAQDGQRVSTTFASQQEAQAQADEIARRRRAIQDAQGTAAPAPQVKQTING